MFGKEPVSDKELQKTVIKRIERTGNSRISAIVQRGNVTLSGKLQYERERRPLLKVVQAIAGVRHVNDELQVPPKVNPYAQ